MKHKEKVKIARRLRSRVETKKKTRVPIFQTEAWERRKEGIKNRVKRVEARAKARAKLRREKLK